MAQTEPSQSTGRDAGTNPAEGFVRFKVDLADHLDVPTIQRLSMFLGLKPGRIDSIKRSKTPGLEMVNLMENRRFITPTGITDLLDLLQKLNLAGLAGRIQSSFQAKTYQGKKDHGLELEEKKRDLIKYLKLAYRKHYETAKPFPSMNKCSVNSLFVEGGIYYLAQEGDFIQKSQRLESYNEILSSPKTKSKRMIIEADPGYGKSTLASQFVYDWCTEDPESPLKDVEILIFLQLRQLTGVKSIYTAIKHAIVPEDEDMDESCIKEILKAYNKSVVMLFDSYDEYPDKNDSETDISSIIEMKMFLDILVIILTRTIQLPPNLHPETKRIRLTGFGVAERRNYVLKAVDDDVQLADRIEKQLQRNPFLRDLCQVPLFSTMVAHIVHERSEIEIFSTVTRFFTYVILCLHNHMKNKKGANTNVPAFATELAKLYRIAFDGLTQKNQQLSWEETYLVSELGQEFYDNYINLGILAQEGVFDVSQGRYKVVARISFKILCEFYASHHLVWILSEGASSAASSINVKETLNNINPLDHQYVYRFACGLNKSAADIIIKHLQKTVEGRQFALLCMLEQEENSDQYLQSVKDLVSRTIIIHSYHAKLLQRSTIQVLEVASANQIPISCVYLWSYSPRVDESGLNLIFQSGLTLSILSSLQKLVISDIDRRLTNEELAAILSYSSQCTSLKELSFVLYDLPNTIPVGSIPSSLKSRNVKVWNNKARDIYHLNLQTGRWQTSDDDDKQDEQTFDVTTSNYKQTKEGRPTPDLNYSWLKCTLTVFLSKNDCHQLARHFALPKYQLDAIINSNLSAKDLLDILEERGVIHTSNVSRLLKAISVLKINETALFMLKYYQRSRGDETSYGRFLAGLSSHLTLSLPRQLCDYFEFTNEKKKAVITSKTPGISFLLTLEDMGVINPLDVGKLVTPLKQYQLVQAVAKVQEYQTLVDERSELTKPIHTLEGKQALFIECLRKKTKSWYETMTPLPWKKSCKWMTSELFIACGLVITDSKSKMKTTDVDQEFKLKYKDILTHERLKSATRIIIEGDPGSGKTMLSSQLAYDWSIGKSSDARMVVFLPLKFVDGMTIIEAIEQFYIPKGKPLNEGDIKAILDQASDENKICIVLDGLEEYNGRTKDGEPSEVERVMRKEKFPNCTVVLTSRSDFVHDLPQCPMLKLGRFGEEERDQYIANIFPDDRKNQQKVKCSIETSALLFDLCSNALLFVYIVHNIEHLGQIDKPKGQLDSVGPFMEVMVNTLLSRSCSENYESSESEIISTRLSEIAFNGLCKGYQQLMWQKSFLDENVSNVKDWIESGILVVEEGETTREEKHQKKGEAVDERMVTQDEILSIDDESSEGERSSEAAAMIGEGQDDILSSYEESPGDGESSTDDKPNETEKHFTARKTSTNPQNLSLQVKFLHKVIQEWFAAKHFSSMLQRSKGQYRHRLFLNRHLPLINPADLHYVLRFTSYLCPENCYLIMEHFHSCYKSSKGVVPEYILNCIFLCFIECNSSVRNKKMDNPVRQVCKNIVTIRGGDSRILQQSKVSMLMYASNSKIRIGTLRLVDLVVEVTKATLTFNSNITLECFPTLKVIEVSRWDMKLKEEDFEELIKFITKCKLLNKAFLSFPSPPPLLTDKKLLSSMKKNLTIEWIIGDRIVHTLDKKSGEWPMQFRSTPHQITDFSQPGPSKSSAHSGKTKKAKERTLTPKSVQKQDTEEPGSITTKKKHINTGSQKIVQTPQITKASQILTQGETAYQVMSKSLRAMLMINKEGGRLDIPDTGASLEIPSGALEGEQFIQMIIIPPHLEGESLTFASNSSLVVELLPCNLNLMKPAILTLPHCLVLKKGCEWKAKIYRSHHKEGSKPQWEEQSSTPYHLGERNCAIEIQRFSWEKFEVDAQIVEAKNIIMYAAGRCGPTNTIYLDIGYYLNLATFEEAISFEDVAISPWHFCTFVLDKTEPMGTDACTCYCKAGQAPNLRNFIFQLKAPEPASVHQPSTSKRQEAARAGTSTAGIEAPDLVVTTATIQDLSHKFCDEWRIVGSKLGIGEPKLQTIDTDNRTAQEKVYQMLLTWKQSKGNEATYRLLGEALQSAGRKDLQEYLYQQDIDLDTSLSIQSLVNKEGGILEIPGTGVRLEIPSGAIEQECLIQMRIIPISFQEESESSFTSNSTVVVELLPDNLKLHQLAKLTLPHCLQLKKTGERKAMVYSSHHAKGSKPMWRPKPHVFYQLNDTNCVIWIESFSWETCEIDGKDVVFKNIQVYAAGNLDPLSKLIPIRVGFYPKLPGERPRNLQILEEIPFLFRKEGNLPLKITFKKVQPMSWKYTGEEKVKTIPYINVAAPVDCQRSFFFKKVGEEACFLVFEVAQEDPVELIVDFKDASASSLSGIPVPSQSADVPHSKKRCFNESDSTAEVTDVSASSLSGIPVPSQSADVPHSKKRRFNESESTAAVTSADSMPSFSQEVPTVSNVQHQNTMIPEYHSNPSTVPQETRSDNQLVAASTWPTEPIVQSMPIHTLHMEIEATGGSKNVLTTSVSGSSPALQSRDVRLSQQTRVDESSPVEDATLGDLSGKINKKWKNVGRNLGLKEEELCILETDSNNQGHKETVYQMLLTWKHSNGSKATYRVLGEALEAAGRRDLQEMLYKQGK